MSRRLGVRLPIQASVLSEKIRVHCEGHGVWDDCLVGDTVVRNLQKYLSERQQSLSDIRNASVRKALSQELTAIQVLIGDSYK